MKETVERIIESASMLIGGSNHLSVWDLYYKDERVLSRILLSEEFKGSDYESETIVGDFVLRKKVMRKWTYLKPVDGEHLEVHHLLELILERCANAPHVREIDPAPHDNKPLWPLHKAGWSDAKLVLFSCYEDLENLDEVEKNRLFEIGRKKESRAIEDETGISILDNWYLYQGLAIVFPYEIAAFDTWGFAEDEHGREYLKARVRYSKHIHTLPELEVRCKLFDEDENCFHQESRPVKSLDERVLFFRPETQEHHKIYRVELYLYCDGVWIADGSGWPLRQIKLEMAVKRDQ